MSRKNHPQSRGMTRGKKRVARKVKAVDTAIARKQDEKQAALPFAADDNANTNNKKSVTPEEQKTVKRVDTPRTQKIYMTVEEWHAVPRNPAQPRDEEKRAKSPKGRHLWTFIPTVHDKVKMAQDPRGNRWKINAHTRDYIWINDLSDVVPALIEVDIIPVANVAKAKRHCREYEDSRKSVLTSADIVHSALMEYSVNMTSDFLKTSTGIASAARYAWETYVSQHPDEEFTPTSAADARDYVKLLRPAINALDKINPRKMMCQGVGLFGGPVLTAYFLAYLKYGDEIMTFFERLNDGRANQRDRRMDPVAAVRFDLMQRREKKKGAARAEHMSVVTRVLGGLEAYRKTPKFDSRDENGVSNCEPRVNLTKLSSVDLDVYFTNDSVRRTGRGNHRNSSIIRRK